MKRTLLSILVLFQFGNLYSQDNLIPNPSFVNAIPSKYPQCSYDNDAVGIETDILDWKTTDCGVNNSSPDWMSSSCNDKDPYIFLYPDKFIYLANGDANTDQEDEMRTGLLSSMDENNNYLFRITYASVPYKTANLTHYYTDVSARIFLTKYSSNWCGGWGNTIVSFNMFPPLPNHIWAQHWIILDGAVLNTLFPGLFNQLHNIIVKCEAGAFYVDYVELSPMCENPLLIQNHNFFTSQDELPYKSGGVLRAGHDVGSSHDKGDVIVGDGAIATFTAATEIVLENGFSSELGSNFETKIESCSLSDPNRHITTIDTIAPKTYLVNNEYEIYDDHLETINCDDTIKLMGIDGDTTSFSNYHWDFGNGQSSDSKSVNIHYNQPGTYLVTLYLTNSIGVTDTLSKTYTVLNCNNARYSSHNISQNNYGDIKIYPNPSSGKFNITLSNSNLMSNIIIYDMIGNEIMQKNNIQELSFLIDLSSYPKGLYFIQLEKDKHFIFNKLVHM